jgi:acylphosphatase
MAKTRAHIIVSGTVQGVFFRQNTKRQAQSRGVFGWVKNTLDGNVEAVFEGEETSVKEIVDYCRHGPSFAKVEKIEVDYEPYKGEFADFKIA